MDQVRFSLAVNVFIAEFVNFTQDTRDKEPRPQSGEDKETKWVEPAPVSFDDLMARIRHIVLTERLRVCINYEKGKTVCSKARN